MKLLYIHIFAFLLLTSCEHKNSCSLKSIEVYYYNYIFEPILPKDCNEVIDKFSKQKTIKRPKSALYLEDLKVLKKELINKKLLFNIEEQFNLMQLEDKEHRVGVDARIVCVINHKDNSKSQLCISGYLANDIFYNGVQQKQNNLLLFLIKDAVGYYSLMSGESYLRFQDELNDKSIKRNKVKDVSGNFY